MRQRLTAVKITGCTVALMALAASTWFVQFLPVRHFCFDGHGFWADLWLNRSRLLAFALPVAIGIPGSLLLRRRFRAHFVADDYPETELAAARTMLGHRAWRWGTWSVLCLIVASIAFSRRGLNAGSMAYILVLPFQVAQDLARQLKPRTEREDGLLKWREWAPLRSNHWGERQI